MAIDPRQCTGCGGVREHAPTCPRHPTPSGVVKLADVLPDFDLRPGAVPDLNGLGPPYGYAYDNNRLRGAIQVAIKNLMATELRMLPSVAHVIRSLEDAIRG